MVQTEKESVQSARRDAHLQEYAGVRPGLPPIPAKVGTLPVDHRGYPIPWFVAVIDGKPDFRVVDSRKVATAVRERRCFICGLQLIGNRCTFVIGPMCAVNRVSSEPPSHLDCARFAAAACPFLARPEMRRRDSGVHPDVTDAPGTMFRRNPGVALLWTTDGYTVVPADGGVLFQIRAPVSVECVANGRTATAEEIGESLRTGFPLLEAEAEKDGPEALVQLGACFADACDLLGVEVPL